MRRIATLAILWLAYSAAAHVSTVKRDDVYDPDDPHIAYIYDYFERLFDALFNNTEHRLWYSGSEDGESWAERNCPLDYDFLDWYNTDYLRFTGEPKRIMYTSMMRPWPRNIATINLSNTKAVVPKMEPWMIQDISTGEKSYINTGWILDQRVRVGGDIEEFLEGLSTAWPEMSFFSISYNKRQEDGSDWPGFTGKLPNSLIGWRRLMELSFAGHSLHGVVPGFYATNFLPAVLTIDVSDNPDMCGPPPYAVTSTNTNFEGTQIGIKYYDEELQMCVDEWPDIQWAIYERTSQPPENFPLFPDLMPEPIAPEAPPEIPPEIPPEVPPEIPPEIPPEVPPEIPPEIPPEVPPEVELFPVEEPAPMEPPSTADVPMPEPPLEKIPESLCNTSRNVSAEIYSPSYSNDDSIPILVVFSNKEDELIYCYQGSCRLNLSANAATSDSFTQIDTFAYTTMIQPIRAGPVIISLVPRDSVTQACTMDYPVWNKTVIVDKTPPTLQYNILQPPTRRSSFARIQLIFDEPVVEFGPDSIVLNNAALTSFKGNKTHFDVILIGDRGSNITIHIPFSFYTDLAGNYGSADVKFEIIVPEPNSDLMATAGSALVVGSMTATSAISLTSSVSSGSSTGGGSGNFVRAVAHTQFLAMCTSLAVPAIPSNFLTLSEGYKWAVLSSKHNRSNSVQEKDSSRRRLLANATSDWLESSSTPYIQTDAANTNPSPNSPTIRLEREVQAAVNWDIFLEMLFHALSVFSLGCCIHFIIVKLVRIARPAMKLPSILIVPKAQILLNLMLVPPLLYVGSMVAVERGHHLAFAICFMIPLPCLFYLLYAVFNPTVQIKRPPYKKIDSPLPDATISHSVAEDSADIEDGPSEKDQPLPATSASLSVLGSSPTLVLEGDDDPNEADEIERAEVDRSEKRPVRQRGKRSGRKLWIFPGPIKESMDRDAEASKSLNDSERLLEMYGPLFEDIIGIDNPKARQNATAACLLCPLLHFICRVVSAILFGAFSSELSSTVQVSLLLSVHSGFFLYLVAVRPYANKLLMVIEIVCNFCEWGIILISLVLIETQDRFPGTTQILFALAYTDVSVLIGYELFRLVATVWQSLGSILRNLF